MARILSIETSTSVCSVAIHSDGNLIAYQSYHQEKSAATLLPIIIKEMMDNCSIELKTMDAIAVSAGPGSYTGLRIGASTAKGLAFALNKPLISISSLGAMVEAIKQFPVGDAYLCPMIDARRMEVYCQLVTVEKELWDVRPLVVEPDSFGAFTDRPIYLFGDGASKTKEVLTQGNIQWVENIHPSAKDIGRLAEEKFQASDFEDVAYFEPFYLKEFQAKPAKKLL